MSRCSIKSCDTRGRADRRLYRFPKDRNILELWLQNTGFVEDELNTGSRICSRHFTTDLLGDLRLLKTAVPTLHLGENAPQILAEAPRPMHTTRRCSVPGCSHTSPPTRFHSVPVQPDRRRSWLRKIGIREQSVHHLFVCVHHFPEEYARFRRLPGSVEPSLNVPTKSVKDKEPPAMEIVCFNCVASAKRVNVMRRRMKELEQTQWARAKRNLELMTELAELKEKVQELESKLLALKDDDSDDNFSSLFPRK